MKTLTMSAAIFSGLLLAGLGTTDLSAQIYPVNYSYNPGTTADGLGTVPDGRDDPENAVGVPDNSDTDTGEVPGDPSTVNFVSLGFGGYIDLVFAQPFGQGEGSDLDIFETSYETPNCGIWPELANVYVSQDGCNWLLIASGECQNFSVELPDNMPWALYVRIEDASPNNSFSPNADGYDVDGVRANYSSEVTLKDPGSLIAADGYEYFIQGSIKANPATLPALNRRNPNKALGLPSESDSPGAPVFVSLGFDRMDTDEIEGRITLTFDYTIFDRDGADISVFETTFGDNINRACSNYPEIAEFWGSNDGTNFTLLSAASAEPDEAYLGGPGRLCRDGLLDISNMPEMNGAKTLRYLKIIDKSIKSSNRFPGGADGYDVDGVYGYPCDFEEDGKYALHDQNNYPDEDENMFFAGLAPNPSSNFVNVKIEAAGVHQNYTIRVIDMMGRIVAQESLNADANAYVNHTLNVAQLPSGVYMVSVETKNHKVIERLIKN